MEAEEGEEEVKQYEIWWVTLPAPAGRRPVLLLSRDSAYRVLERFIVAEVTTRIRGIPQELPLGRREGLPVKCVANLDSIRSVARAALTERAGGLSRARVSEVKRAAGHTFAWPELTLED